MRNWVRLDNAAKIFPTISNKSRTNLYSIAFYLNELVDPIILQEALEITISRFKSFRVRLRAGIFWYYLEEIRSEPVVIPEKAHILETFDKYESRGYLFRIMYFQSKITIEVFHSLTDAYGATQFMKSLIYQYLILKGHKINPENKILINFENSFEETSDSFLRIYDENIKADTSEERGLHFKGTPYEDYWLALYTGIVPKTQFKSVIEKYQCSYTQFLVGAISYSAMKVKYLLEKKKYPFQVFVPVDLRRMFQSKSLRNFSMIVKAKFDLNPDMNLGDYIEIAKSQLKEKLQENYLLPRINGNVKYEKMFIMRIVPLFIKKVALKIGYAKMSTKPDSFCVSNLGNIDLPKDMEKFVDKIIFSNGSMKMTPLNMGVTYYKDNIYMTITSSICERDFQREFFRVLVSEGLDVTLETNDCEG